MTKFPKAERAYNFPAMEERILAFWREARIFEKSVELPSPSGKFLFFEGPPTANAMPHVGHALTRVTKDLFPRYKTMQGFHVKRKAGWDTHGLPVEIEVEKELGLNSKGDIETYGVEGFNAKCKESVLKYEAEWERLSERIGFWLDYENAYFTFTNDYVESVWWILKQMWDKGLLYQGHKVLPYCFRCGTTLSSHEVAQNYQTTKDPSVYVKFRIKRGQTIRTENGAYRVSDDHHYFLVWTTTPWTLISNVALAINPEAPYALLRFGEERHLVGLPLVYRGRPLLFMEENQKIASDFLAHVEQELRDRLKDVRLEAGLESTVQELLAQSHQLMARDVETFEGRTTIGKIIDRIYKRAAILKRVAITLQRFGDYAWLDEVIEKAEETRGHLLKWIEFPSLRTWEGYLLSELGNTYAQNQGNISLYEDEVLRVRSQRGVTTEFLRSDEEARKKRASGEPPFEKPEYAEFLSACKMKGADLAGLEYEPLFPYYVDEAARQGKRGWYVVTANYVTLEDGTGIVHQAPAFGEEDYRVGQQYGLPFINAVNEKGAFKDEVTPWAGVGVKDADKGISFDLNKRGLLFHVEGKSGLKAYSHEYPFCWRCESPLIYFAKSGWFFKTTAIKDRLIALNQQVNWLPAHVKDGRFGNWLENAVDWAISRERYWGCPLPIWECPDCGSRVCFGGYGDLFAARGGEVPAGFNPHRPFIDEITVPCPDCKATMHRVPEVLDCWFESGAMPYAQVHYPFEERQFPLADYYPADFISEAVDQTRGWFYTLMVISAFLFDKPAFNTCIVLGHILNEDGQKMSKHKGDVVDPWVYLNKQGADALRWHFFSTTAPWNSSRFYERALTESQQRFIIPLWNVYSFFTIYANIDGFDPTRHTVAYGERSLLDTWILIKFNRLAQSVTANMDAFLITESAKAVEAFVDDLSNWYLRRSRRRFWKPEKDADKWAAYATLYEILVGLAKVIAPFVPFIAEELYQNLIRTFFPQAAESVHLERYPAFDPARTNEPLEREIDAVLKVVNLGRAARNMAKLKVRQPLAKMIVVATDEALKNAVTPHLDLVLDELNVKACVFGREPTDYVDFQIKLLFPKLGPRLGKLLPKVKVEIDKADHAELVQSLKSDGKIVVTVEGDSIELASDEVEVTLVEREGKGLMVVHDEEFRVNEVIFDSGKNRLFVVLDTQLTQALIDEGIVREVINRIQNRRKEMDLDYVARIRVKYTASDEIAQAIDRNVKWLADETLAVEVERVASLAPSESAFETDLEGESMVIDIAVAE